MSADKRLFLVYSHGEILNSYSIIIPQVFPYNKCFLLLSILMVLTPEPAKGRQAPSDGRSSNLSDKNSELIHFAIFSISSR